MSGLFVDLDPEFRPPDRNGRGQRLAVESFQFPAGEPHLKFPEAGSLQLQLRDEVVVTWRFGPTAAHSIVLLPLAVDALRRMGARRISAFLPYIPFGRQDRVMVPGEPFSLKVMAEWINRCRFRRVRTFDPHSEVTPALIDRCEVLPVDGFLDFARRRILAECEGGSLAWIAPDAGAGKRLGKLHAQGFFGEAPLIECSKRRDLATGKIVSYAVHGDVRGRHCIVVDDLCDGGATFEILAQALVEGEAASAHLVVSHGVFSKGIGSLLERFCSITTTNSFPNRLEPQSRFHVYPLSLEG